MASSLTGEKMVKRCLFLVLAVSASFAHGASGVDKYVSVMEGDSVTLYTDVEVNQQLRITWYFNSIRIAQINGALSKICTDDQCYERFRDRLKLDHHTGSLTIMNTKLEDSGDYQQSINRKRDTHFNVFVYGDPAVEQDKTRRKAANEEESVALRPSEVKTNGSGLSAGVVAVIAVSVLLLTAAACVGVMYCCHRSSKKE